MNFIFLKFFLIVCFSKTIICDSSVIITLGVMLVNHKIQIFWIFRNFIPKPQFNSQDRTPRVRFRPLQGSYLFSYRLEVSARGRGYRFGLLRRRGDILSLWRPLFSPTFLPTKKAGSSAHSLQTLTQTKILTPKPKEAPSTSYSQTSPQP